MVRRRAAKGRWTSTAVTKDHIIPQSHPLFPGDRDNVVLACARCNEARGHAPAIPFLMFAVAELQARPQGSVAEVRRRYREWLTRECRAGRLKLAG